MLPPINKIIYTTHQRIPQDAEQTTQISERYKKFTFASHNAIAGYIIVSGSSSCGVYDINNATHTYDAYGCLFIDIFNSSTSKVKIAIVFLLVAPIQQLRHE